VEAKAGASQEEGTREEVSTAVVNMEVAVTAGEGVREEALKEEEEVVEKAGVVLAEEGEGEEKGEEEMEGAALGAPTVDGDTMEA
jgi:hypothetical protein